MYRCIGEGYKGRVVADIVIGPLLVTTAISNSIEVIKITLITDAIFMGTVAR
jgi:hypothetical protein